MEPSSSDAFWLSLVSGVVFLVWGYHLWHAFMLWRQERRARSFRNLFIAVMLQLGLFRIWLGATVRAVPDVSALVTLQDVTAPVLSLMLLSGGFVVAYTWWRDS